MNKCSFCYNKNKNLNGENSWRKSLASQLGALPTYQGASLASREEAQRRQIDLQGEEIKLQ